MKKKFIALIMTFCMIGCLTGCGKAAGSESSAKEQGTTGEDVIRIGVSGPTTGSSAEAGVHVNTGIQMAVDEVNTAGGIEVDGVTKKVEVIYYDTGSNAQTGLSNCEKLITSDKVDFLFCESFNSAVGIATMELARKYDIPMATLEPVSSAISDKIAEDLDTYKHFFKFGWDSGAYGETCSETVLELVEEGSLSLPNKTIAVCADETDYGRSNIESVVSHLSEAGYTVVSENYWEFGSTDLYSVITDIKNSGADMIFSCSTTPATGVALIKQLKENGLSTMPHMAIYFPFQPEFVEQIGSDAEKLLCTPMSVDTDNSESDKAFAEQIKAYNGDDITFDHMDGYSCTKVVLESFKKAASLDADKWTQAMLSEEGYDTPKGHIVFEASNHTTITGDGYVPVKAAQIQSGVNYCVWPESSKTGEFIPFE
ncbi:MAG: ABC transporter substrate-binding protein [Lachnospiraceae bacterium]|nr:ABC transporter substrate-binding protein [Lachnospiraceae bacterium]